MFFYMSLKRIIITILIRNMIRGQLLGGVQRSAKFWRFSRAFDTWVTLQLVCVSLLGSFVASKKPEP